MKVAQLVDPFGMLQNFFRKEMAIGKRRDDERRILRADAIGRKPREIARPLFGRGRRGQELVE